VGAPLHQLPGASGPRRHLSGRGDDRKNREISERGTALAETTGACAAGAFTQQRQAVIRLCLFACSDDYLLEQRLNGWTEELLRELPGLTPERLAEDLSPADLAVEVCSPSLFADHRLIVVPDVRPWLDAAAPAEVGGRRGGRPDVGPLVAALDQGLPDGVSLVLGAWCAAQPKGDLVEIVAKHGHFEWLPLPPPPKPWEKVDLSSEQRAVLLEVLRGAAGQARFTREAEGLLFDRLGFAPRLLAQEVVKLASAAGPGGEVDAPLVRALVSPKERSLEIVQDAVFERHPRPLLELIEAADAGLPVCDWRGQRIDPTAVPSVLFGQISSLLQQLLDLRLVAREMGCEAEMDPRHTSQGGWYGRRFKDGLGPRLAERLADRPSPLTGRGGRPPKTWTLGQLFVAAGRYQDQELVDALAACGDVEAQLRGPCAAEALAAWIARLCG
jgi:hypothetical protein